MDYTFDTIICWMPNFHLHRNKLSPAPVDRTRIEVNVCAKRWMWKDRQYGKRWMWKDRQDGKRWMWMYLPKDGCGKTLRVGRTGKEVLSDMSFLLVYSTDLLPSWHNHCSFREKMDRRHGFIYTLNSYPITHKHKILPRAQPSPSSPIIFIFR